MKLQAVLIPLLLCSLAADFGLILYALTRSDRQRSLYITILSIFLFVYTLGYLAEVFSQDAASVFTALRIENFGIPFIAPMFLLTTLSLFWTPWTRPWYLVAALCYGFGMALVVLTNPCHQLYYTSIRMVSDGISNFAVLGKGPLYIINQAVVAILMVISYSLIFARFARGSRKLRRQMLSLIVGAVIAMSANVLNFSGLLPAGLDPTPFALGIGISLFAFTLFRGNLTDVVLRALDTAVEEMNDAIVVLDESGAFLHGNHAARRLFPQLETYSATAPISYLEGWPPELSRLSDREGLLLTLPAPQAEGAHPRFVPPGGRAVPEPAERTAYYRAEVHRMENSRGKHIGWSVIFKDVTDMTHLMEQLEQRASIDALTGILNRSKFFTLAQLRLTQARERREQAAMLLFDIDWFKRINDSYGHAAGDEVLKAVTGAVAEALRPSDLFGRLGGEEFVVLAVGLDKEALADYADRLRDHIRAASVVYEGRALSVSASFGVALIPPEATLDAAIRSADRAMYEAKSQGRDRVIFLR